MGVKSFWILCWFQNCYLEFGTKYARKVEVPIYSDFVCCNSFRAHFVTTTSSHIYFRSVKNSKFCLVSEKRDLFFKKSSFSYQRLTISKEHLSRNVFSTTNKLLFIIGDPKNILKNGCILLRIFKTLFHPVFYFLSFNSLVNFWSALIHCAPTSLLFVRCDVIFWYLMDLLIFLLQSINIFCSVFFLVQFLSLSILCWSLLTLKVVDPNFLVANHCNRYLKSNKQSWATEAMKRNSDAMKLHRFNFFSSVKRCIT
jgi:hypothetical protein